ncbi:hypothetical protein BGZ93_006842 [Podila epicladia]|nr:hypothetical protein BGZ93_006842 [Podila epicladia]
MRGARTRDASVTSLPKPSHDDMILPAVARRIKEEGLFNHDVIAYSDDYNAPLYRLPTTQVTGGNPFASYDREKAASSTNLSSPKGQSALTDRQFNGPSDEIPTASNRHEENPLKKSHEKQSGSASTPVPRGPSPTPLERRETPSPSPIPEAIPQVSTSPRDRRTGKESDAALTTVPEQSIPAGSRPDRPRRTRRNTEGRQRIDLPEQEQYVRQQSPTSDRKGKASENDIQVLDVRGTMQGNDRSNRQQRRRSKMMDQESHNVSNDFYADIQSAEAAQFAVPKKPAAIHQRHENNTGYQRRQNQYSNNEGGDRYDQQYDQQYSNNKNHHQGRQYRDEDPTQRSPKSEYDRQPQQAHDPYNYGHQQSQQQYQQYHQESKSAQEPQYTQENQYAQRQQRQQEHYNQPDYQRQDHAQGGRSRYNQQQNYGVDQVQGYDNQDYDHSQPSRQHDEQSRFAQGAAHIQMSQFSPEPQLDTHNKNNPEAIDGPKMKKKGAVCCIIC